MKNTKIETNKTNDTLIKRIPVTVITGFLGSGKTTLINRILSEDHGIRFAVIENEFGEIGIDQELVINEKEEVIEMSNGCICCTVRGDLIRIITNLIKSERPPEHILIETTGLADPSPVAQTFLTDQFISEHATLDGIVTLVDSKYLLTQLENTHEAKDQLAFADVILINKIDLINEQELVIIENRIREINKFAILYKSEKGNIDLRKLFNIGGFDVERALSIDPKFMEIEYPFEYGGLYNMNKGRYIITATPNGDEKNMKIIFALAPKNINSETLVEIANPAAIIFSAKASVCINEQEIVLGNNVHNLVIEKNDTQFIVNIPEDGVYVLFTEHLPEEFQLTITDNDKNIILPYNFKEFREAHSHDETVSSVGVEVEGDLDPEAFNYFINGIIDHFGNELYRYKGIVAIKGESKKIVLQGVHMIFDIQPSDEWGSEIRKNTIIFIGKNLDRNILSQGFLSCLEKNIK